MTTIEAEIVARLERAASQIHPTSRLAAITGDEPGADANQAFEGEVAEHNVDEPNVVRYGAGHRLVTVAAASLLLLAGIAFLAGAQRGSGDLEVAASEHALVEFDLNRPVPLVSELLPDVADPPAAFGEGRRAEREGQQRTGQWTSAALARPTFDGYEQPIVVSVLRGDAFYLAEATPLATELSSPTFGQLVSVTDGPWAAVATQTEPRVTVSGAVDLPTLLDVLDAMAPSKTSPDRFVLDATQLPEDYVVIVEPTAMGEDRTPRNVLADDFRDVSINEISDRADPLLAAALAGGHLQAVDVGTATGWTASYEDAEFATLRSLIWSPQPGVVLEISVVAERWSLDDTIALAESVKMVTPDQWNLRYPG